MMEIGIKIKEMRLKKQLTQEELADRCELTKGYISQIENDLTSPSIATLKDILQVLGSSLIINLIKIGGLNKQARELETQKNAMLAQIEKNDEKIDYMSSDLYVDQFARENLGYIGAGEELFVGK